MLGRTVRRWIVLLSNAGTDAFEACIVASNVLVVLGALAGLVGTWLISAIGGPFSTWRYLGESAAHMLASDIAPLLGSVCSVIAFTVPSIGDQHLAAAYDQPRRSVGFRLFVTSVLSMLLAIGWATSIFLFFTITTSAVVAKLNPAWKGNDIGSFLNGVRGEIGFNIFSLYAKVALCAVGSGVICAVLRTRVRQGEPVFNSVIRGVIYCVVWVAMVMTLVTLLKIAGLWWAV